MWHWTPAAQNNVSLHIWWRKGVRALHKAIYGLWPAAGNKVITSCGENGSKLHSYYIWESKLWQQVLTVVAAALSVA